MKHFDEMRFMIRINRSVQVASCDVLVVVVVLFLCFVGRLFCYYNYKAVFGVTLDCFVSPVT